MLEALRAAIRDALVACCHERVHRDALLGALARPGFALHPESPCRAGLLTLEVYRAIRGMCTDVAFQAAAGIELQAEAAYMFDHVGDRQGRAEQGLTPPEELALAIATLACGNAVASSALFRATDTTTALRTLAELHASALGACAGQFLDAHLEKCATATTDDALKMTVLKSGSIGKAAAGFGAGLATADAQVARLFGEFGLNLFTYCQLIDDLRDACPSMAPRQDLDQGKKTLPLVFFLRSCPEARDWNASGIMSKQGADGRDPDVRAAFEASGAQVFCAIVAESFLGRAKSNLADLRGRVGTVERLERFVAALEVTRQEIAALP